MYVFFVHFPFQIYVPVKNLEKSTCLRSCHYKISCQYRNELELWRYECVLQSSEEHNVKIVLINRHICLVLHNKLRSIEPTQDFKIEKIKFSVTFLQHYKTFQLFHMKRSPPLQNKGRKYFPIQDIAKEKFLQTRFCYLSPLRKTFLLKPCENYFLTFSRNWWKIFVILSEWGTN